MQTVSSVTKIYIAQIINIHNIGIAIKEDFKNVFILLKHLNVELKKCV